MPTAPDLQNRMKIWHFLNVLKNSWNLQNLLKSPPETCMWNLRQFGEVTIFEGKMPTALDLQNRMKLWHFLNVLQNSWNLQNLLESPPETCMWNLRQFGDVTIFEGKMPTAPDLQNRMKFWHSLNVLQNSWNLQNLLESPPETCMWNLRQFGEVTIFDGKMPTAPTVKTGWNFDIFSMFSKIHEVYRIYWNQHLKHACEIWGSSEKLQFLTEKCLQRQPSKQDEILTFTQFSPKFIKLPKVIGITTRNMHVKFEAVRRCYNFWRKNAYSVELTKQDEILTFSQSSPKFMKFTEFIEITTRNMHVKFEAVWRSYNFWQKMPTALDLRDRMKFWLFLNVLQNSWNLQELLESPPETCMWNLRQFGEVTIFDGKMPTAPTLQNRMKFWLFLNVLKNSWNLQNLLKSPPETCMWNLRQFGEVTIFWQKMRTAPDLRDRMKFWLFLNVLQNSWSLQELLESPPETCMWNLRQFGEVTIFDGKMPTAPNLQNRMKFWHFLNVLKNSWNLQKLLESPPETCMWNLRQFREVKIFDREMPTAPDLKNRMEFRHSLNFLQNSWNLQNLLESPPETCMWNLRQFGEVTIFDGKMPTAPDLQNRMKFWLFSMFSKIHEIYRIYLNHHKKHACEIWGSSEKLQFLTENNNRLIIIDFI